MLNDGSIYSGKSAASGVSSATATSGDVGDNDVESGAVVALGTSVGEVADDEAGIGKAAVLEDDAEGRPGGTIGVATGTGEAAISGAATVGGSPEENLHL